MSIIDIWDIDIAKGRFLLLINIGVHGTSYKL